MPEDAPVIRDARRLVIILYQLCGESWPVDESCPFRGARFAKFIILLRAYPRTAGDWLILRSLRSKMCLSPFSHILRSLRSKMCLSPFSRPFSRRGFDSPTCRLVLRNGRSHRECRWNLPPHLQPRCDGHRRSRPTVMPYFSIQDFSKFAEWIASGRNESPCPTLAHLR
jgi:hypothetical protein